MINLKLENLILVLSLFIATTTLSFAQPPNTYRLHGDNLQISYMTTSFTGRPMLSYDDGNKIKNFIGNEIRTVGTEIGTLVSVTIRETENLGSTTFTLLIPKIELDSKKQNYIQTEGIITRHKFPTGTNSVVGQLDSYRYVVLKGTADLFYY